MTIYCNNFKIILCFVGLYFGLNACSIKTKKENSFNSIEQNFHQIPDQNKLAVYWYWMSDNISKEGVIKDLKAMKKVGINRAFIGNIGIPTIPYGKVKIFSDEWWDILHTALKTASELHIEIGIFNSPGWSQSGGPWVKPKQAMRYLCSNQTVVQGPLNYNQALPIVANGAQDVKVIAYPALQHDETFVPLQPLNKAYSIDLISKKSMVVRSLTIKTIKKPCKTKAELFVKRGTSYISVCKFEINRSNPAIHVGFEPYAPIVLSIPEIKASTFRLVIDKDKAGILAKIELSSIPKVERYPEKSLAKMFQKPLPMWNHYLWRKQPIVSDSSLLIPPHSVIDLTLNVNVKGILKWHVPKGKWIIMRTAMVPTGSTNSPASSQGTGLETDKMSKEHITAHFKAFIGQILKRIPKADRKTFHIVVEDSYETGGQNWTDTMITDFTQRYGYSPVPYLPVLQGVVIGSQDQSDRFLWDMRRLIADKIAYDYVAGLRDISHKHNLTTWLENYGHWGFPGEFLQYGGQSDEIGGEFWSIGSLGNIENKAASSCGHIYGKKKIWAESFTCGGPDFYRYPAEMKQRGDRFFTEGINATLLHLYIQQPDDRVPGINAPFGNEFNRHNTWFSQLDVFIKYLKRCNYMLQQGSYIADVAYFIGEDTPKMTGVRTPELPKGYAYDYINAEILLNNSTAKDGKLTLDNGMQYRILVLPPLTSMRPEVLCKIKDLVREGITILGSAPTHSPSLQNYPVADREVKRIADELWKPTKPNANHFSFGKGNVYRHSLLQDVFADQHVYPDCLSTTPYQPFLFIHRQLSEGDIYFISNQKNQTIKFSASFRITGKKPELWNPQTSEIRNLTTYKQSSHATLIPMTLQPYESAFIIFRTSTKRMTRTNKPNYPVKEVIASLTNPYIITFQKNRGGPRQPVQFKTLTDWSKSKDNRIKYFSGTATYHTHFTIAHLPNKQLYIDLGEVKMMAKIKLNGVYIGGVWTEPYRLNITKQIKEGINTVDIQVVNNWMNRLIGDKKLPKEKRITWQTFSYNKPNTPLQRSGLLGPVEIQAYSYDMIAPISSNSYSQKDSCQNAF